MNKSQSIIINDPGDYSYYFIANSIIITKFIPNYMHGTNWVSITQVPCYLEGTSEKDLAVIPANSGSALRAYNNATIPSGGTLQPRTGYSPKLLAFNQKDLDNAKKLMELEFSMKNFTNDEIKDLYKQVFNLSDNEIKTLIKEIEDENAKIPSVNQYQYIPIGSGHNWYLPNGLASEPIGIQYDAKSNGNVCKCEMVPYQGLFESYNYCKHCGKKE